MNGSDLNFHIGDKVVYPNHGVGVIEQISSRSIGATIEKFYLLNIKASSLKVMVPCANVGSVGLRRVVRNGEIQKILDYLTDGDIGSNGDWKDRFKENSERMRCSKSPESSRTSLPCIRPSRSPSAKKRCLNAPATCWSANWPWPATWKKPRSKTS